jgi:predicted RNase H-like HicB family nuclease
VISPVSREYEYPFQYQYLSTNEMCYNIMTVFTLTAVVHKEEDMYGAECPEVGTVSQGQTLEEAVHNLKEATELYLEEFPLEEKERSFITTFEVAPIVKA